MKQSNFDWDPPKYRKNLQKHQVAFEIAQHAFKDPHRVIAFDRKHSTPLEKRFFCYGMIEGNIMTVRFTMRSDTIRIIGAGYWREGRKKYHEKNNVH